MTSKQIYRSLQRSPSEIGLHRIGFHNPQGTNNENEMICHVSGTRHRGAIIISYDETTETFSIIKRYKNRDSSPIIGITQEQLKTKLIEVCGDTKKEKKRLSMNEYHELLKSRRKEALWHPDDGRGRNSKEGD